MDFSLPTLFVVPQAQTTLPSTGSTQNLTAGQLGLYKNDYAVALVGDIAAAPYFYVAQGRSNTYLQGTKRSDKINGCLGSNCKSNVLDYYKVTGCPTPTVQITEVSGFSAKCGDVVTLTLRLHSNYIDTLYFNGLTRSVTVQAPCCECDGDPCTTVNVSALIDQFIAKLLLKAPGMNPDNILLSEFLTFENIGGTILRITGKALTKYAQPCDLAAFPYEYDRMWFRTFVYSGPATTADFIVSDACNIVANAVIKQRANYAKGTSEEIKQMEKNFYSYQAGYMKHLNRLNGYNGNFESWVVDGQTYDTYYIKFNEINKAETNWQDAINMDATVIIACIAGGAFGTALETVLAASLGAVVADTVCITTTSTTSSAPTTTTTTTAALIP